MVEMEIIPSLMVTDPALLIEMGGSPLSGSNSDCPAMQFAMMSMLLGISSCVIEYPGFVSVNEHNFAAVAMRLWSPL